MINLKGKDFLKLLDFTTSEIEYLIDLAQQKAIVEKVNALVDKYTVISVENEANKKQNKIIITVKNSQHITVTATIAALSVIPFLLFWSPSTMLHMNAFFFRNKFRKSIYKNTIIITSPINHIVIKSPPLCLVHVAIVINF